MVAPFAKHKPLEGVYAIANLPHIFTRGSAVGPFAKHKPPEGVYAIANLPHIFRRGSARWIACKLVNLNQV